MSTDARMQLLSKLNVVEGIVLALYKFILGLLFIAIVAGTVAVIVMKPWGAGNQGEWFYFTIAVVMALGWVLTKFAGVRHRQRELKIPIHVTSTGGDGAHTWEFRWGGSAESGKGGEGPSGIHLKFSSLLPGPVVELTNDKLPLDSALQAIEAEVARGAELDNAIALVDPKFSDRPPLEQHAYRMYVTHRLNERQDAAT